MSFFLFLAVALPIVASVFLLMHLFRPSTGGRDQISHSAPTRTTTLDDAERQHARLSTASMVVDAIKMEMGRLRSDVVWTIENSALWDVSVPTSRRFFTALTVWDDHRGGWSIDETVLASAELKVLWGAALDTATRLGIDHLSAADRVKADTAVKLVRKADSTTSSAERHQLMVKAAEVLSGIMSITLPRETMRELERGYAPQELGEDRDDVDRPGS